MTFFEHVDSLEDRALALPKMVAMLERLHRFHESLNNTVVFDRLWRSMIDTEDKNNRDRHYACALQAGFIEAKTRTGTSVHHVRLTDKGRAAIGAELPFYKREYAA